MYNDRETLLHHRQLLSEKEAAADLELLKRLRPNHPRLEEFSFSPKRSAGDILLELLAVAHRDDIVKNRLQARMSSEPKIDQKPEDADQKPEDAEHKSEEKKSETPVKAPAKKTAAKKATAKKSGSKKK